MPAPFSEILAKLNSADSYTSFCFPKLNPTTNFAQNWQFFALTKEINCLIYFESHQLVENSTQSCFTTRAINKNPFNAKPKFVITNLPNPTVPQIC
jgi:hypothetical protein